MPRQRQLDGLVARLFPPPPPVAVARGARAVPADDRELLERAFRARNGGSVEKLWNGDWSAYTSQSEADLALCAHLAFWSGDDPARVDQLFRQSGLMREKWDAGRLPRADDRTSKGGAADGGPRLGGRPRFVVVELGGLLDAVEVFVRRFVVVDEAQATAVALWVAHTWAIDAAHATPYLFVDSRRARVRQDAAARGAAASSSATPLSTMNISDAALFRAIEAKQPTLFFDEVDAIFSKKARERGARTTCARS